MTSSDSLRNWLRQEILQVLNRRSPQPPLLIWCDPQGIWKELLQAAAEDNTFELWAEDTHELILRERFYKTPRTPRVVWLPVSRDDITYFKVFELQAEAVEQLSLPEALSHYGIDIPSDYRVELEPILPAHAKEWLDYPKDAWKELTPGNAKSTLVDDEKILEFLATPGLNFDRLVADNRFSIFARRVVEDFGLPEPKPDNAEAWRIQAAASLLVTDTVTRCPNHPPTERDRIIPEGQQREAALKLLDRTLEPFGLNPTIERYVTLIRRLRSGGYNTIVMVTDHGFFRWQPAEDENDPEKPEGDILWKSRRAIAGQNLQHSSAIKLRVTNGNLDCYVPRSINAFKTYGGLGFFHGGATLQELIIPVLTANWHKKAKKIEVVLKPITQITSLSQRIEVAPAAVNTDLFGKLDATLTTRQVQVNVVDHSTGKRLFKSKTAVTIEPGGELQILQLDKVEGAEARVGTELELRLIDADDEEILDRRRVVLKVDLDEWF